MTERLAGPDDLATLQSIELAAGVLFHEIGMTDVAEHPPPSLQVLEHFQSDGRAWVPAAEYRDLEQELGTLNWIFLVQAPGILFKLPASCSSSRLLDQAPGILVKLPASWSSSPVPGQGS